MTFFFRQGSLSMAALGPVLEVGAGVSTRFLRANRLTGWLKPGPVTVRLLVDTGATLTCLRPWVFTALKIGVVGRAAIHTPSTTTPHPVDVYEVDVVLDTSNTVRSLRVFESELNFQGIDGLLGRDVLEYGLFNYEGMRKTWSIEIHPPPYPP